MLVQMLMQMLVQMLVKVLVKMLVKMPTKMYLICQFCSLWYSADFSIYGHRHCRIVRSCENEQF
jgi:hypothetical protein